MTSKSSRVIGEPLSMEMEDADLSAVKPEPSFGQFINASFKKGLRQNLTPSVARFGEAKVLEAITADDPMLSPIQANNEYKFEKPITKPLSRASLDLMIEEDIKTKELDNIINNGDNSLFRSAAGFTASLSASFFDPLEILLGLGASKIVKSSIANGLLSTVSKDLAQKVAISTGIADTPVSLLVAEGISSQIVSESIRVPITEELERREVGFSEIAFNTIAAGAGIPLILKGASVPFRNNKKYIENKSTLIESKINAGKKADLLTEEDKILEEGVVPISDKDKSSIRQKANSPDNSIGTDKDLKDDFEDRYIRKDEEIVSDAEKRYDEMSTDQIDEKSSMKIKEAKEKFKKTKEDIRQVTRALEFCLPG